MISQLTSVAHIDHFAGVILAQIDRTLGKLPRCEREFILSDNYGYQCSEKATVCALGAELAVCDSCYWEIV